jgi:hypothetical protein
VGHYREKELRGRKTEWHQNLTNLVHSIYYNIEKKFVQKEHKTGETVNYAADNSCYLKTNDKNSDEQQTAKKFEILVTTF